MKTKELYLFTSISFSIFLLMSTGCRKDMREQPSHTGKSLNAAKTEMIADSIITIHEAPSGGVEAVRLRQIQSASDFTPTGFYLPPNTALKIHVEQLSGSRLPSILIGTYSRYKNKWHPASFQLHAGDNTITDNLGGLIYISYNTDQTPDGRARITFGDGKKPVPYFVLGQTTHADWLDMLNKYGDVPDVQLVGDRVIFVTSLSKALEYKNEDQEQVIQYADRIINIEDSLSGLWGNTGPDRVNTHKYLMTETDNDGIYMLAAWWRVAVNRSAVSVLLTVDGIRSWGPWHELGHMHQQAPMTWGALTEVTVNIYSLAVERAFGFKTSRLHNSNIWPHVKTYLALPDADRDYNGNKSDLWVKLAMFQQLWLAFGDTFYQQLHRRAREENPSVSNDMEKMRYFMLTSCNVSGKNLSNFFRQWGFKVPESVYTEIDNLDLPEPDTDITTLED